MFTTGDVTLLNLASGKPNLIFAMDESSYEHAFRLTFPENFPESLYLIV